MLMALGAFAQDRVITGTVKDANGEGLPGASVYIKGTTRGTVTDFDGKFSLNARDGETLVIQSIGYLTQEILLAGQSTLDLQLQDDIQRLEEIVVVGYGTQQKKDLTGAVTKISSEDFNPGPITNPLQQINGRAAGVTINQVGGEPGQRPNIRIRGITSLDGGNDPLVVVDGIQGNLDLLNQIPPSEIESIDILKDASATAIYGSRGAAGVVLVTTKKGKAGATTVDYSGVFSFETVAQEYDVLDAAAWRAEAARRGVPASADFEANTDWFDLISRGGFTHTHNLGIGGGSNNFSYRASATVISQEGIIINSGYDNFIGRLQATQRALNDKLVFNVNLNAAFQRNEFNNADRVSEALSRRPTDPVYTDETQSAYFRDTDIFNYLNPFARAQEIIDGDETNNIFGSLRADYEIIEGLTASFFGSWRRFDRLYGQYQSPLTTIQDAISQNGIATRETNRTQERLMDLILNYKKTFGEHSLDFTFVYEWQKADFEGFRAVGRGFVNDFTTFNALQSADLSLIQTGDISSYRNDRTVISFLGRINYSFKDRYLFTVSVRRDGASVFGENNEWGNFPAASFAWRITNEEFMANQNIFDELKLRVGYGITGNQQGLGPQNSVTLVSPSGTTFFGGVEIPNFAITQNANPDLRWERREMYNVGLDFGFLDGRLSGTFDFYYGITSDLLFRYRVPQPPFPFGEIRANVGESTNTGVELSLNYLLLDKEDFTLTLGGNLTSNRTEVTTLSGELNGVPLNTDFVRWGNGGTTGVASQNDGISYLLEGQPIGTFFLFKHVGVDENGVQIVDDLDGDGIVEDGDQSDDRYIAGQALPKVTWAFTPSLRYKNFDMNLVLRGAHGHKVYNARRAILSAMGTFGQGNVLAEAPGIGINNITYASDFWLEDAGFVRLENLTFGYNFNTANLGVLKTLRLSFTANNLFVITGYKGIDPELRLDGGSGGGIDFGVYPRTINFAFGLSATFQ
ncbi:MAG: SusC/RagA family TonB-linked outer membrane protein [Microscillaceae bacterium]